jgi:hypothetical protein
MFKKIILTVLLCVFIVGCAEAAPEAAELFMPDENVNAPDMPPLFEVGTVKVIANQTEHKPYIVPIGSISEGLAVSMVFQPLEAIAETLPAIIYADDFELIITGEYADNWVMTLYDSQFEMRREVRNSAAFSSMPDEAGEYFLGVHVIWQNNESGADFEQASIVYYFKVVIA